MTPGMQVRVRDYHPPGHVRAPSYLRGKRGVIERICGAFDNPEQLAYGVEADVKLNCRVRFSMAEVWGDAAENPDDTIDAELYDHWLEPIDAT